MRDICEAYDKGYDAYFDGLSRDDNPYPDDSDDFDSWHEGWDNADSDDDS